MKLAIKKLLAPLLYRTPSSELSVGHLYLYLDALMRTRHVPGAVVEVDCFQGGTAAFGSRLLRDAGVARRYVCVDTFSGFMPSQFDHDAAMGTRPAKRLGFRSNSRDLVRMLLDRWECRDVELVQGDIMALPAAALPDAIAVALVDVDLEQPTYAALQKIAPRLASGGTVFVDDCDAGNVFQGARLGYERFMRENGREPEYVMGMGVL